MTFLAACRLGKVPVAVPESLETAVAAAERAFWADLLRSKPLGVLSVVARH